MTPGPQFTPEDANAKPESLQLLFSAYPLLPMSAESCGGAEQVLATLEYALAQRGHSTTIAACNGSRASGRVFATGEPSSELDQLAARQAEHNERILELLQPEGVSGAAFDLLHDHNGGFWRQAGAVGLPVLATLHLPRAFYPDELFRNLPENVFFNCVSQSQSQSFADVPQVIATVRNGIRLEQFPLETQKGDYLLWMGRLCEEKGAHVAIDVARSSGMRLVIAGAVYPFSYHREYFEREIRPYLGSPGSAVEYVGIPTARDKYALLANARALLIPSLIEETSSLTAMESMACGTPVVALARGALPEVVVDGVSGRLACEAKGMIEALRRVDKLDPLACRSHVEANYSAERMADEYEALYAKLIPMFRGKTAGGSIAKSRAALDPGSQRGIMFPERARSSAG
jgi:glycosyltransferase involved in cell wall biosynthesis